MTTAHILAERLDDMMRSGLRQGTLHRRTGLTARQVRLVQQRPDDVDSEFATQAFERVDTMGPRDILRDVLSDLRQTGVSMAALVRESGLSEREVVELLDADSVLGHDRATIALDCLTAARSRIDGLLSLAHRVRSRLDNGLSAEDLARWLDWNETTVDRLLSGSPDFDDASISDAERRLSAIPRLTVVGDTGLISGLAGDEQSARDAESWWEAFDIVEARGRNDWSPLATFAGVTVRLLGNGEVLAIRLPDDRDAERLIDLIEARHLAERRSQLLSLFPESRGDK
jgi:hypothetical protein